MKQLFILFISLFCIFTTVNAQNYTQKGTTFIQNESISKKKSSAIETKYTWQDSKGNTYPIYLSKNGKAFVKMISKKTGKEYHKYLDEEISIKLCKEYNIAYIPKKENIYSKQSN